MITFQKDVAYKGNPAKSAVKSVAVSIQVPVFAYAAPATAGDDVIRITTSDTQTTNLSQFLNSKTYKVEVQDSFATGTDAPSIALSNQYYLKNLLAGNVDSLSATATIQYLSDDNKGLGSESFDFLCLPKLTLNSDLMLNVLADRSAPAVRMTIVAVNKQAYSALRKQLASTSLAGNDGLILRILSYITAAGGDAPAFQESAAADVGRWLDDQTSNADSAKIIESVKASFAALYNFPLAIPEISKLDIAGKLTIVVPDHSAASTKDFLSFVVSAECQSASGGDSRILSSRFNDSTPIIDNAAPFSLTSDTVVYRNELQDPIVVGVRGVDGSTVWSKEFSVDDTTLTNLNLQVPAQIPTTLTAPPEGAALDAAKRLRGRVLVFNKDCVLKDALVLVQAKKSKDAAWRVVGAVTTDGLGNFTMPYPYGTYVQAQAMVSLAPKEAADIPIVAAEGDETLSDDFLYLLLNNPDCPSPANDEECSCASMVEAKRLPDFSDLIGSDTYSQDIGGSCVNLSKPNRTISEFNYQAIVRTSDPYVANYTLTRIETGIESIDISLAVALSTGASVIVTATSVAMTNAVTLTPNVATSYFQAAINGCWPHVTAIKNALSQGAPSITISVLAAAQEHIDAVSAILQSNKTLLETNDLGSFPSDGVKVLDAAGSLKDLVNLAIDAVGISARYELAGGATTRLRQPIALNNPIAWQDAPETTPSGAAAGPQLLRIANIRIGFPVGSKGLHAGQSTPDSNPSATLSQAVTIATGHILHYKALFKADGYSLGDLIYSLPLAPGQKKEIVVFDASHTLVGTESQALNQNERLAMGLVDERDITDQLAGSLSESLRGSSSANTSGISAGFGTGGQGYGGTGAYGGSGSAVLGVAGGVAQASSTASQDSSRDVAQFFGEKLRQSIMQNAEGYRQLNASVVTTVQEGQRYGVTSEVVANHNHCHALTMMYFEVLRHYAIFQKLSSVEECVFVPFLLTRFSTENVAKWRDILAPALLLMPSDTYLQPFLTMAGPGRQHPLIKAFDADQRIKTHYANVDFPVGAYDDEPIRFVKGEMTLRVNLPRPRTRYDRILSFPVVTSTTTTTNAAGAVAGGAAGSAAGAIIGSVIGEALVPGLGLILGAIAGGTAGGVAGTAVGGDTTTTVSLVKQQIFDLFMQLDANFQSVPPAQCIRIKSFQPTSYTFGGIPGVIAPVTIPVSGINFFENDPVEEQRWTAYAKILGFPKVLDMLDNYFAERLISEWDDVFNKDIAPAVFTALVESIQITKINSDFTSESNYEGGERLIRLFLDGTISKKRNQLPSILQMSVKNADVVALKKITTVIVENLRISYSTAHYNGILYSGNVNDALLDGTDLYIPENPDEKRNPRREDRYLAAKLIEHLNSNLEYYNKVLWRNLDPDRRYMLLDGFSIQIFNDDGTPVPAPGGFRSLASVVKNELITVAGNSLVFPVAPGCKVSGSYIQAKKGGAADPVTLLDHYKPLTPIEPFRISVPSKGVFAEAVQGACNACEEIETERLQDWSRFPIGDEPTTIAPVTTPTPVVTDWKAAFKDFAPPMVNIQNAPATPAPGAGLQGLSDLLGKSGIFKDITGLDANQQNAIRTYLSNQDNAKSFAEMAKEMAMQSHNTQNTGKIMDSIKAAKDSGAIDQQEYGQLVKDHLQQQIDGGVTKKAHIEKEKQTTPTPLTKAAVDASGQGREVKAQNTDSEGNTESVDIGDAAGSDLLASAGDDVSALRKGLLPTKGVTDAQKIDKILSLFGDAPIRSADDANLLFGSLAYGANSTYLTWLKSRASALGMEKDSGYQVWEPEDAAGNSKRFKFNYSTNAEKGFAAFWNGIPTIFSPRDSINLMEFLALDLVTHIEGYGDYAVVSEAQREGFGLDYFFEANWVDPKGVVHGKKSYNTAPNRTATNLFADADFQAAHQALLPAGATAWNPADAAWGGSNYAATKAPTSIQGDDTAYIRQADFFKFRGRGYIQTTNRDNYLHLAKVLRANIDSIPSPMWPIVTTWAAPGEADAAFLKNLTQSRDEDWNNLFTATGGVVALLALQIFNQNHRSCFTTSAAAASLIGNAAGTVGFLGDRINSYGSILVEAVREVLLQMYDSLT